MSEIPHLLVHEHADNVGVVVVEGLTAGTDMLCCVTHDNSTFRLTARRGCADRPQDRAQGFQGGRHRIKYGEDIGKIIADIPKGGTSTPTIAKPSAGKEF
jgi:(2R)-sulfolactate sulfo-lyase subunit alpha